MPREKHTSLSERVRRVVSLATGAVWQSEYELYAQSAARAEGRHLRERNPGPSRLAACRDDLSEQEKVAHRYARQFSAGHRVDADLYSAAVRAFGEKGVVDLVYLIGIFQHHLRVAEQF